MDELMRIGEYITVLRDGRLIDKRPKASADLHWIVRTMIGEESDKIFRAGEHAIGEPILEARDLRLPSTTGRMALDGISFKLRRGEVLGIYGLMGAGRTEVLETIMGLHENGDGRSDPPGAGIGELGIRERIRLGISLVPEDRQRSNT